MAKRTLGWLVIGFLVILISIGGQTYMNSKMSTVSKYPTQPITIIVPFSAGGGMDLVARALEKVATKHLGQPLVVVNKLGGAGSIAWNELSSAPPDGYTIGLTAPELLTLSLYGTTKYHYPTALEPLAQISNPQMILVVNNDQNWDDLPKFITYAKQHPGELKFGHSGIGSIPHLVGEAFAKSITTTFEQVPFRGGSEATTALLGKHVQIAVIGPSTAKEHIKKGTLRALAVTGEHRLSDPALAQIPTFQEQGFDVLFNNWHVIAAPKDLPPEIKTQLTAALKDMILDPEFQSNMNTMGIEVEYLDAKSTAAKWITEREKLTTLLQETGIVDLIKNQKK